MNDKLSNSLHAWDQVYAQVNDQVLAQVRDKVWKQINEKLQ